MNLCGIDPKVCFIQSRAKGWPLFVLFPKFFSRISPYIISPQVSYNMQQIALEVGILFEFTVIRPSTLNFDLLFNFTHNYWWTLKILNIFRFTMNLNILQRQAVAGSANGQFNEGNHLIHT